MLLGRMPQLEKKTMPWSSESADAHWEAKRLQRMRETDYGREQPPQPADDEGKSNLWIRCLMRRFFPSWYS